MRPFESFIPKFSLYFFFGRCSPSNHSSSSRSCSLEKNLSPADKRTPPDFRPQITLIILYHLHSHLPNCSIALDGMIASLPIEIQVQILSSTAGSALRATNSHFYLLYNDLYFNKLVREFGEDVVQTLQKVYPWLRKYIKSLDHFRRKNREIVSKRLDLKDAQFWQQQNLPVDVVSSKYIKDSWKYVYALFKNKRLFADYSDYRIDEPSNYIYNHYVEINRTYLLSLSKTIWLAPGKYNLNIGLVVKHGSGLGTTKFEVSFRTPQGDPVVKTFYPPTNINEILPKNQFCLLKVAEFEIPRIPTEPKGSSSAYHHKQLYKVQLVMEEIGLYLKSGFTIYFIDFLQPSMLFNDYDLLYYTCKNTDYRKYINIPLKSFYKVLSYVQNQNVDDYQTEIPYGEGDPARMVQNLDSELRFDGKDNISSDKELLAYADFFFANDNKRSFKFNTVYQRRQFINRFGSFEDGAEDEGPDSVCTYDPDGLKWKVPILGEL